MTYMDMTFCSANCATWSCDRNKSNVGENVPEWMRVSWADFSGQCKIYEPIDKEAA